VLHIKVLGPGCANCQRVEQTAKAVVQELGLEAIFQKVTRWDEIMKYNILATPGLVVNGKVVCSGRVPTKAEVTTWLTTAEMESA
jgi:small redox-active disulfide protein 2